MGRSVFVLTACLVAMSPLHAQQIDSVHVFTWVPDGKQTAASAKSLVWKLRHERAPHTTLKGEELAAVNEAMNKYRPSRPVPIPLPDLAHLAMIFSNGRPLPFGVTEDLERLLDLTRMREYRISDWTEHDQVRALLAKLLLEH